MDLAYKLSIGVAVMTVVVSLLDLLDAPIFLNKTASIKAQVIGQDAFFVIGAAVIGAYTRHYLNGVEMRPS
jgi:hypothetical protein